MPFLVCDEPASVEGVKSYVVFGFGAGGFADPLNVPAWPGADFGFKLDIGALRPGTYNVKAQACNDFVCSLDSAPFVFTVPEKPGQPTGLRITG
jgi:hypothetical protein